MANEVRTTCPYCGVGCGVIASRQDDGKIAIAGDKDHPANFGELCSKGMALAETLGLDDRLLFPELRGRRVSWDAAIGATAEGLGNIREKYGPGAIAVYASGQLMTEDYYVANKLMKGFIGSSNIDTNSRLCMSSSVAGHKRAFGSDTVPGNYQDWDQADLVVLVGSNAAWCHPVLFKRFITEAQQKRGAKLVVIDPRRTSSCYTADLHLALTPGSDVRLFNGLLVHLFDNGFADTDFVAAHTTGMTAAVQAARQDAPDLSSLAGYCGLTEADIRIFFDLFSDTRKVVTVYSQGVNQSRQGTDKVNGIINCHLLTGRIGRAGMGPFSVTGQPNAMGGREVGGLANTLAAHMEFDDPSRDRVGRFWKTGQLSPEPGLKAVDMFRAIHEGQIKAIWIMATNPAVSMPDANYIRAALDKCELVIVSDVMQNTDTVKYAHIALPAQGWGEKDGTVTNSERRISRQRNFLPSPGETRPDWWIISQVAKAMGYWEAFEYYGPEDIFREHVALSGFENNGTRDFDLSGLRAIRSYEYEALSPVQWPVNAANSRGTERLFGHGCFYTNDKRARFIPVKSLNLCSRIDESYPIILNSGRIRDQWHSMTRTGKSPGLNGHLDEPFITLHPEDAAKYQLVQKGFAEIRSRQGKALVRVRISEDQKAGQAFMPIHWTDAYAAQAVTGCLIRPVTDPISGQPEFKHTPVQLRKWVPKWHGFLLSRQKVKAENVEYWCYSYQQNCHILELADTGKMAYNPFLTSFFSHHENSLTFSNPASGQERMARFKGERLELCLFCAEKGRLPDRSWLQTLFLRNSLDPGIYGTLLSGQPQDISADTGPIVCACYGVGQKTILATLAQKRATTVDDIGHLTKAGSNCGSCRPEIKDIINSIHMNASP